MKDGATMVGSKFYIGRFRVVFKNLLRILSVKKATCSTNSNLNSNMYYTSQGRQLKSIILKSLKPSFLLTTSCTHLLTSIDMNCFYHIVIPK